MAARKNPESDELQKISTALVEFSTVDAGLAKLRETYGTVVYDVSTRDGMEAAKAARAAVRKPRYEVERIRKDAKAPLLELGRRLDREAKRITDALIAIEEPIDRAIVAEEERVERERQARIEAERIRVAKLQERVSNIRGTPRLVRVTTSAETIGQLLAEMTALTIDASFEELQVAAEEARQEAVRELADLHRQAQEHEARAEAVRRETERLRQERAEQEARERAAREQREAAERAHRERMAEIEARERAIAERERQQREREAAEAARSAAPRPPEADVDTVVAPCLTDEAIAMLDDLDADAAPAAAAEAAVPAAPADAERPANWPIQSFDADDWAREFVRLHGGDVDLMRTWFASALMRGFDEYRWRQERAA